MLEPPEPPPVHATECEYVPSILQEPVRHTMNSTFVRPLIAGLSPLRSHGRTADTRLVMPCAGTLTEKKEDETRKSMQAFKSHSLVHRQPSSVWANQGQECIPPEI